MRILTPWERLPIRIRVDPPMSDDELLEFCAVNRELRVERTKEGELIVMAPTGGETGRKNAKLTTVFGVWAAKDGTGEAFDSSTEFILPNGAGRSPDVSWIRKERWEALPAAVREKFPPLCPDFVIELKSPTDSVADLRAKMEEYRDNGAVLGWLIDRESRTVEIYRPGRPVQRLDNPKTVSGDPELPGFVLELADVW